MSFQKYVKHSWRNFLYGTAFAIGACVVILGSSAAVAIIFDNEVYFIMMLVWWLIVSVFVSIVLGYYHWKAGEGIEV